MRASISISMFFLAPQQSDQGLCTALRAKDCNEKAVKIETESAPKIPFTVLTIFHPRDSAFVPLFSVAYFPGLFSVAFFHAEPFPVEASREDSQ